MKLFKSKFRSKPESDYSSEEELKLHNLEDEFSQPPFSSSPISVECSQSGLSRGISTYICCKIYKKCNLFVLPEVKQVPYAEVCCRLYILQINLASFDRSHLSTLVNFDDSKLEIKRLMGSGIYQIKWDHLISNIHMTIRQSAPKTIKASTT